MVSVGMGSLAGLLCGNGHVIGHRGVMGMRIGLNRMQKRWLAATSKRRVLRIQTSAQEAPRFAVAAGLGVGLTLGLGQGWDCLGLNVSLARHEAPHDGRRGSTVASAVFGPWHRLSSDEVTVLSLWMHLPSAVFWARALIHHPDNGKWRENSGPLAHMVTHLACFGEEQQGKVVMKVGRREGRDIWCLCPRRLT